MRNYGALLAVWCFALASETALAHGGRLNRDGCHDDRATRVYHCHRVGVPSPDGPAEPADRSEAAWNQLLARQVGGTNESQFGYQTPNGFSSYIRVDVETADFVIEAGLDKRSSLDSVQQALFASALSGKKPMVVIYDTDGTEGPYEYRIRLAAEQSGVTFLNPTPAEIVRLTLPD